MFSDILQCCAILFKFQKNHWILAFCIFQNQGTIGFGYLKKLESKNHGSQLFQKPSGMSGFYERTSRFMSGYLIWSKELRIVVITYQNRFFDFSWRSQLWILRTMWGRGVFLFLITAQLGYFLFFYTFYFIPTCLKLWPQQHLYPNPATVSPKPISICRLSSSLDKLIVHKGRETCMWNTDQHVFFSWFIHSLCISVFFFPPQNTKQVGT